MLDYEGLHGGLAIYRGDGYCFHSRLVSKDAADQEADADNIYIDAKPREAREARLRDAVYTLEQCAIELDGYSLADTPRWSACEDLKLDDIEDSHDTEDPDEIEGPGEIDVELAEPWL